MMETFIILGLCFILYEALDFFQGCRHSPHQSYRSEDRNHLLIESNENSSTAPVTIAGTTITSKTVATGSRKKTSKGGNNSLLNRISEEHLSYNEVISSGDTDATATAAVAFDLKRATVAAGLLRNENRNESFLSTDNEDDDDGDNDDDESCDDDESLLSSSGNYRKVFSISENLDNFNLI